MKTRNEIYGGTFSSPEAPDTNTNGELKKLVLSDSADITKNRSSWIRTIFYNIMDSFTHKEEDRATSANLGVSGAEPTTTKYVTVEQLPSVDKTTNDFTGTAGDGALGATQNTIDITPVLTGTSKSFVGKLHVDFVAWLLARTWTQNQIESLVSNSAVIRVGTITSTAYTTDDSSSRNIIVDTRTIGKGSSGATLNDDKYETLWKHLYDSYPDAICTLNVARTTRDADWTANRTLTLPKIYGKVLVGKDGTQTEFDTIGETGGAKTHLLAKTESGRPDYTFGSEALDAGTGQICLATPNGNPVAIAGADAAVAHNNLQPYVVLNYQITY